MLRFAALLLVIPLAAQSQAGKWSFGIHGGTPELKGNYSDSGNSLTDFNIKDDFNLDKDSMGLGARLDYMGARFGFSLDYGVYDYAGQSRINRTFEIAGQKFEAGMNVTSSLKNTAFDFSGTVKVLRADKAWLGVDLGVQVWSLDVKADGVASVSGTNITETVNVNESYTVPIPQIGVSCGYQCLNDRLVLGARARFLAYSGASYTRFIGDARYYVTPWLGLRFFADIQSLDAPNSSIIDNVEAKLDRNALGFGVVSRW